MLGTSDAITVADWFGSDPRAQVQEIKASDAMIDGGLGQLLAAMNSYQAANPGFNPATAAAMPNDPALRNALAGAWHH